MTRHKWQPTGGCKENPGVYDNGNGGLIFTDQCLHCGLKRKTGKDYTRNRPGNNFGPLYFAADGTRVWRMKCEGAK